MTKKKTGRPSKFTQDIADEICAELAQGRSLRTVCRAEHIPHIATVFRWMREHDTFREQYARAKEESADAMAEDILDISDDATNDYMEIVDKDGAVEGYKLNGEAIQRSKLRVDSRKWLMAKMKPKRYGEKLDIDANVTAQVTEVRSVIVDPDKPSG